MEQVPAEFIFDEQPLPTSVAQGEEFTSIWAAICAGAEDTEQKLQELHNEFADIREQQDAAKRKFYIEIIEQVMDNLDRMISVEEARDDPTEPKALKWFKRVKRTRRTLEGLLALDHVVPIDLLRPVPGGVTVEDFIERDDVPDGTILEAIQRGWLWRGETFRKAKVIVARNTSMTTATETAPDSFSELQKDD